MNFRNGTRDDDSISIDSTEVQNEEFNTNDMELSDVEDNHVTNLITPTSTTKECLVPVKKDEYYVIRDEIVFERLTGLSEVRKHSKPILWKGVEWTSLFVVRADGLGVFFGYDDPTSLPPDFAANVSFRYVIDNYAVPGVMIHRNFVKNKNAKKEREDYGRWGMFPASVVTSPGRVTIKFTLKIKENFQPKRVPVTYDSKKSTGMVGLENLGATCYLNSLLQMLFHLNSFRKAVYQIPHDNEDYKTSTTLALQNIFHNLQTSNKEVTTKDLTVAFGWTSVEAFMQQDVQEMMRILIDKLEDKMKNTLVDGYAKELFCGKIKSFIRCIHVDYESAREEEFYDIQLDVKGCLTLYDSFNKYIETEILDGDNQYDSGKYGKQDAKKGVIFTKLPPILTIQLKRFDFDFNTLGFKKIHDCLEFPLQLDLERYVLHEDSNNGEEQNQKQAEEDETQEMLEEEKGEDGSSANHHDCQKSNKYLLHSVLVHSGDVGGGHYYAYIRPTTTHNWDTVYGERTSSQLTNEDLEWYKFNDETVLQVSKYEAVDYCFGRRSMKRRKEFDDDFDSNDSLLNLMSSAYMLVYVRESDAPTIMKPIEVNDIPPSLIERLQEENRFRKLEIQRTQRAKMFRSYYYATEKHIANFNTTLRLQGFIDDHSMKKASIMSESTYLGVFIDIARSLKVSPTKLRLWEIDKKAKMFCVSEVVKLDDLDKAIPINFGKGDSGRFFVEIIEKTKEEEEEEKEVIQTYKKIIAKEKVWLEKVKQAIFESDPDLALIEEGDEVSGCGIGKSNKPLKSIQNFNNELYESLLKEIKNMSREVFRIIDEFGAYDTKHVTSDSALIFYKLYDPMNLFSVPSNLFEISETIDDDNDENASVSSVSSVEEDIYELFDPSKYDNMEDVTFDDARFLFKRKKKPYNPVKYLGYVKINLTDPIRVLKKYLRLIIQRLMERGIKGPEVVLNGESYLYYMMETPLLMKEIKFQADEAIRSYFYEGGGVTVVSLNESIYSQLSPKQTTNFQTNPAQHYRARANTKTFHILPWHSRDRKILYNKAKFLRDERHQQPHASDRNNSLIGKKRPFHSQPAHGKDLDVVCAVELEFNLLEVTVGELLQKISTALKVESTRLLVYFNPHHDEARASEELLPVTAVSLERRIIDYLQEDVDVATLKPNNNNVNAPRHTNEVINLTEKFQWTKLSGPFLFYYRIIPYPVVIKTKEIEELTPTICLQRFFEVVISDERLRFLRRLAIEHAVSANTSVGQNWKDYFFEFYNHPYNGNHYSNNGVNGNKRLKVSSTDSSDYLSSLDVATTATENETEMITESNKRLNGEWLSQWFNYMDVYKRFFSSQSENNALAYSSRVGTLSSHDITEYHKLRVRADIISTINQLMSILRTEYLGVPDNYDVLYHQFQEDYDLHHSPADFKRSSPSSEDQGSFLDEGDKKLELTEFASRLLKNEQKKAEVESRCSDALTFLVSKKIEEVGMIEGKEEIEDRSSDSDKDDAISKKIEEVGMIEGKEEIEDRSSDSDKDDEIDSTKQLPRMIPAMPLLLGYIVSDRIVDIFVHRTNSQHIPSPWFSSDSTLSENNCGLSLQSVTLEDLFWLSGNHDRISSRAVSVFNFTLIGNTVQYCDSDMFSGPFITYIREDDNYWTFLQRCAMITGEKDLHTNRLAVVDASTPHFIAKPDFPNRSPVTVSPNNHQTEMITETKEEGVVRTNTTPKNNQQQQSIWDLALKYYPMMSASYLENQNENHQSQGNLHKFVYIGIQRSSAEVKALTTDNVSRRKANHGIRIS